jgi:hypothetical protein
MEICAVPPGLCRLSAATQGLRPGLTYAAAPRLVFAAMRSVVLPAVTTLEIKRGIP